MEYKFEVIASVDEILPTLKELTDSLNKTMQSLTGKTVSLRGTIGVITVRVGHTLLEQEIGHLREKIEELFREKCPHWRAEIKRKV